jgi:uncharacterized protein (TIGR02996 family)
MTSLIERLFARWRETRSPELGDAIDHLVLHRVARIPDGGPAAYLAAKVLQQLEEGSHDGNVPPQLFEDCADSRMVPRLNVLLRRGAAGVLTKRIEELRDQLLRPVVFTDEDRALADEALRVLYGDLGPLYRNVWRDPDSDAPRLVLADALLEKNDARGDLIRLQLAGKKLGNTRGVRQIISRPHRICGALAEALDGCVVEDMARGFLARARAQGSSAMATSFCTTRLPEWSTVTDLILEARGPHAGLLLSPTMRALRTVVMTLHHADDLVFLDELPPVGWRYLWLRGPMAPAHREALARCRSFRIALLTVQCAHLTDEAAALMGSFAQLPADKVAVYCSGWIAEVDAAGIALRPSGLPRPVPSAVEQLARILSRLPRQPVTFTTAGLLGDEHKQAQALFDRWQAS